MTHHDEAHSSNMVFDEWVVPVGRSEKGGRRKRKKRNQQRKRERVSFTIDHNY